MGDSFADRLKAIRREREDKGSRPEAPEEIIRRSELTKRSLRAREQVQKIIEAHSREFLSEVPRFELSKGFYESKYSISLSDDELRVDAKGEIDKFFSRITFLLAPQAKAEIFELTCKQTVRNRDMESESVELPLTDDENFPPFREFIEQQFLRYADKYFSDDGTRTVDIPSTPPEELSAEEEEGDEVSETTTEPAPQQPS